MTHHRSFYHYKTEIDPSRFVKADRHGICDPRFHHPLPEVLPNGILVNAIGHRNHKNAIGFSFRFYSTEMVENEQIRLLALNGVKPTKETIRSGAYPISSNFFAVTASPIGEPAPEETNEDLRAFIDWILSEQGQEIIEQTGYVGVN